MVNGGIQIIKDEVGIKFYFNNESEPSAVIYDESNVAILKDEIITSSEEAEQLSELLALVAVFIRSLQMNDRERRYRMFDVVYINDTLWEEKEAKYTPNQVLKRLFSGEGQIVTVDKKNRIRFQFKSFRYKNGKIIVNYNPVIW